MSDKQKTFAVQENWVMGIDALDIFFASYLMDEKLAHVRHSLRSKRKVLESENLSYRIINHWESEGLISDVRPSGKGWRKYSMIDRFWIEIIIELRSFGYPLELIKKIKQRFEHRSETESDSCMPFLEGYFVLAFFYKTPCYLLAFPNGEAILTTPAAYNFADEVGSIGNHIKVNLNRMLQKLFPEMDLAPKYKNAIELSPEEMELMLFVRTGDYESITVKRKSGKIEYIEGTETLSADARLTEILKEQDYQNIEVKTANGKVVCIKRTIKRKV